MRALWIVGVIFACKQEPAAAPHPLDLVPDGIRSAAMAADEAATELQKRLGSRLIEEMARAGPASAIDVCREEAPTLTSSVRADLGFAIGRTSHRLRSSKNVPPDWAAGHVARASAMPFDEVRPVVFDLGDRIGLLRPIQVQGACLSCHGSPDAISPAVRDRITAAYPEDRATGFALGDLRGWIWVEAPKSLKGGD
jgi:hypothetical protein